MVNSSLTKPSSFIILARFGYTGLTRASGMTLALTSRPPATATSASANALFVAKLTGSSIFRRCITLGFTLSGGSGLGISIFGLTGCFFGSGFFGFMRSFLVSNSSRCSRTKSITLKLLLFTSLDSDTSILLFKANKNKIEKKQAAAKLETRRSIRMSPLMRIDGCCD